MCELESNQKSAPTYSRIHHFIATRCRDRLCQRRVIANCKIKNAEALSPPSIAVSALIAD
jgi:hypothetical protein